MGVLRHNGTVTITESKVTENQSALAPGGIFNQGGLTVDEKAVISENRPTNCTPSAPPVEDCFG
ncbi:hypothetical protein [Micromonospora chokoriensis]|uniref:hypothetical protein n=1 Tax=Micromonospora chokoriensis TaxID=356851 RepID=UPI000B5B02DC|nr:hypothetical protein [Micromonospora chokoriensis]